MPSRPIVLPSASANNWSTRHRQIPRICLTLSNNRLIILFLYTSSQSKKRRLRLDRSPPYGLLKGASFYPYPLKSPFNYFVVTIELFVTATSGLEDCEMLHACKDTIGQSIVFHVKFRWPLKVTEHSVRARFGWGNSARLRAHMDCKKKTNMPSI